MEGTHQSTITPAIQNEFLGAEIQDASKGMIILLHIQTVDSILCVNLFTQSSKMSCKCMRYSGFSCWSSKSAKYGLIHLNTPVSELKGGLECLTNVILEHGGVFDEDQIALLN